MEIANHWGPVDAHKELPPERLEELFMYMPERRQGGGLPSAHNLVHDAGAGPSAGITHRHRQQPPPAAAPASLSSTVLAGVVGSGTAQRAQERAYNEAIIGELLLPIQWLP